MDGNGDEFRDFMHCGPLVVAHTAVDAASACFSANRTPGTSLIASRRTPAACG